MTLRSRERIAVTGLGLLTSLGHDVSETFRRLVAGERGIAPLSDDLGLPIASVPVAALRDLRVDSAVQALPRSDQMALLAAREALGQSGLENADFELLIGETTGAAREAALAYARVEPEDTSVLVRHLAMDPLGATAANLRARLPHAQSAYVVCSACSSGALAIALGAMRLEQGAARPQLVGGTDALSALALSGFGSLGALSPEACRPFDAARRGLNLGEGAALLVLESERMVRARGAKVLAWLDGYAMGAEAHHLTHPEAEGTRAAELLSEAMQRAGLEPKDVGYVSAHGTATLANDVMEARAIRRALGPEAERVPVSSSKGQLGHSLGAAGAIEAAIVVQALNAQVVVPSAGLETIAPDCALCHVQGQGRAKTFTAALSTSFGFGGAGAVLAVSHAHRPDARAALECSSERWRVFVTGAVTLTQAGLLRGSANADLVSSDDVETTGGVLPFDPLDRLVMERSRRFDRLSALTTLGVVELLDDAAVAPEGIGLVVGNALGNVGRSAEFIGRVRARGAKGAQPAEFPQLLISSLSGNASIYAGLKGPVFNVVQAASSGESSLEFAVSILRAGCARGMIAGTAEMADSAVLAARDSMAEADAARICSEDGAAFLFLRTAETLPESQPIGCEVQWTGLLRDLPTWLVAQVRGERVEVYSVGPEDASMDEARGNWIRAGAVHRELTRRVGEGWHRSACCLAVAASRVLAGKAERAVVLSGSPGGKRLTLFCRVSR